MKLIVFFKRISKSIFIFASVQFRYVTPNLGIAKLYIRGGLLDYTVMGFPFLFPGADII